MSRKITIVKKNLAPAIKPAGVSPRDPWSSFSEATEEELLARFLNSRGINPNFVSKDTKISHSKSGEFLKWKRDHEFQEQTIYEAIDKKDMVCFDIPLLIRVLEFTREEMKTDIELHNMVERLINMRHDVPLDMTHYGEITQKLVKEETESIDEGVYTDDESIAKNLIKKYGKNVDSHQIRLAHHFHPEKHKTTPERITNHVNRLLGRPVAEEKTPKPTALDRFRKASAEREKKHNETEKNSGGMTSAIDRLQKHLNKEDVELDESKQKHYPYRYRATYHDPDTDKMTHVMDFSHKSLEAAKKHAEGSRLQRRDGKEDKLHSVEQIKEEQIDEISKSTLASYKDKSTASLKNAQVNRDAAEHGKHMSKGFADLHKKSDEIAKKRVKGLKGYLQRKVGMKPTSEDVYQDTQAATQTCFDGANNTDDTTMNKKREMSKSARMIKSLYKHHKVVKEDMYDHEKEDKSVQTYGKKPKIQKPDEENNKGEDKPAALMSGGTTLTGEKRDDVEIDPMMKNRPGQNQFNKEFGKKGS